MSPPHDGGDRARTIGRRRLADAVLGNPATRRLAATHAVDDFADALITLSFVGSLFFSVSLEASRGRIALYLLLTAVPLALVAPVVGPALDRMRAGYRITLIASHLVRAVCALLLASSLLSLAFYPLIFGILLSRKAYDLAKTAMIANLVPSRTELAAASGHLARTGTIAGGAGTAVGGAMIAVVGVEWLPLAAAAGFVCAAVLAARIPETVFDVPLERAVVRAETPVEVRRATSAVGVIRAATGALTFLLALSIKGGGGDQWIFVAALVAAGVGTFLGTMASARLHRVFESDRIVVLTLLVPGVVSALGALTIGSVSIVAIAFAIGLGGSIASREMDAFYGRVPRLVRGRAISRAEFIFQLANVTGAAIAVVGYPRPRVGYAAVALALVLGGLAYAAQLRLSLRDEAGRWLLGRRPHGDVEGLPQMLLAEALRFAEQGDHQIAVVLADSAVRVLDIRAPETEQSEADAAWAALASAINAVISGASDPPAELSVAAVRAAQAVIDHRSAVAQERSAESSG